MIDQEPMRLATIELVDKIKPILTKKTLGVNVIALSLMLSEVITCIVKNSILTNKHLEMHLEALKIDLNECTASMTTSARTEDKAFKSTDWSKK